MSILVYEELLTLNKKLEELLSRYSALKIENLGLKGELEKMKAGLLERDERIKELEKKYERSKLTGALMGGGENALEAKKKITELVREIDRCVALLNR